VHQALVFKKKKGKRGFGNADPNPHIVLYIIFTASPNANVKFCHSIILNALMVVVYKGFAKSSNPFSLYLSLLCWNRKSSSILGSIIPDSVADALDPTHHQVLQCAVTAGVKRWSSL